MMNAFFISAVCCSYPFVWSASHSGPTVSQENPVVSNLIIALADLGKNWTRPKQRTSKMSKIQDTFWWLVKHLCVTVGNNHLYVTVSAGVWQKETLVGSMMKHQLWSQDSSYQPNFFLGILNKDGPLCFGPWIGSLPKRTATGYWQSSYGFTR